MFQLAQVRRQGGLRVASAEFGQAGTRGVQITLLLQLPDALEPSVTCGGTGHGRGRYVVQRRIGAGRFRQALRLLGFAHRRFGPARRGGGQSVAAMCRRRRKRAIGHRLR